MGSRAPDRTDRLTFVGHSTTLLELAGARVLTDPLLRGGVVPLRWHAPPAGPGLATEADVVLLSHQHRDHLDLPSLRRVPPETPVMAPRGAGRVLARSGSRRVHELSPGESFSAGPLTITAVPAWHDGRRGRWGGPIEALGYLIEGGGRRAYFAGDTDLFDEMSELAPLDLALLPVWGWGPTLGSGHLDPERAARSLAMLRPRLAVPIHWGTLSPPGLRRLRPGLLSEPPLEFARLAAERAPEVTVRVLQPGEATGLEPAVAGAAR